MNKFYGRKSELAEFASESTKSNGSLFIIKGRRRIGKSELIKQFGKIHNFKEISIQGIHQQSSNNKISKKTQIENFCELVTISQLPKEIKFNYSNWNDVFFNLSKLTNNKKSRTLLILDEISWMAQDENGLLECFKTAWDNYFQYHNVSIFLCGSVSSWIQKNIIQDKSFEGRITKSITLEELTIDDAKQFWTINGTDPKIKLKSMCITGGVSKYLQILEKNLTAEQNIQSLCFNKNGFLYQEFNKIFNSSFDKNSTLYKKILNVLIKKGKAKKTEILKEIGITSNLEEVFNELILAGYIKEDSNFSFNPSSDTKDKFYSIKDNYTLFYLKYIEPNKFKIEKNIYKNDKALEGYSQWKSVSGLVFENLVRNNIEKLLNSINLTLTSIHNYSPYSGRKDKNTPTGFQIDLLIEDKNSNLYLCEFKMQKKIGIEVVNQVENKIKRLSNKINKKITPTKVLVYSGELTIDLKQSGSFHHYINFDDFFKD